MFVTDRFVYLHLPKTGGTFVAATLAAIHRRRGDRVDTLFLEPGADIPDLGPSAVARLMLTRRDQHGRRRDIPARYADRPILASIRTPFDRYVSQYEFAWWRHAPDLFGPPDVVRSRYPAYPDLTFEEFVHLANDTLVPYRGRQHPDDTPGFHTQQFVDFFVRQPDRVFPRLWNERAADVLPASELSGVHFLNQPRLNQDLARFLSGMGYSADEVAFAADAARVLPPEGGRPEGSRWEPYYTPALTRFVREKERLLFEWFPEFRD